MMDLKRKRLYKKVLYSKVTLAVLLVLIILVAKAAWNAYGQFKFTRENLKEAKRELAALEERRSLIEEESEALSSEEGLERAIRERLPVAKAGEEVIIIVPEEKNDTATTTAEERPWWKRWWQKVF